MCNRSKSLTLVMSCVLTACCSPILRAGGCEQVSVAVGEEFTVKLASIPGTGYSWTLARSLPSWLEKVDKTYVAARPELLGGDGMEYWKFRATATGNAALIFQYKRPWESKPIKVHVCQVTAAPTTDPALVLYLPFDEGTGATAHDLSRYRNRGTIAGAAWVPGHSGTGLEFANGSHVMVPEIPVCDVTSAVSLLAWVKATMDPIGDHAIDGSEYPINGFDLSLVVDYGRLPWFEFLVDNTISAVTGKTVALDGQWQFIFVNNSISKVTGKTLVMDGQWHFVAATFGNKTLRLYVDGGKEAEVSSVGSMDAKPNNWPVMIGGIASSNGVRQYYGSIDEVMMYNRELSADEVMAIFQKAANITSSMSQPEVASGKKESPRDARHEE